MSSINVNPEDATVIERAFNIIEEKAQGLPPRRRVADIPVWNPDGTEVKTVGQAAAHMGVQEEVAAHYVLEAKHFYSDDLRASALEALEEKVIRRVRTPAGQKRYGQPIGSIIVRDGAPPLKNIFAAKKDEYDGATTVTTSSGKKFHIAQDPDDKQWYALDDADMDWDTAQKAKSEEALLTALDKAEGGGKAKPAAKPLPKKTEAEKRRDKIIGGKGSTTEDNALDLSTMPVGTVIHIPAAPGVGDLTKRKDGAWEQVGKGTAFSNLKLAQLLRKYNGMRGPKSESGNNSKPTSRKPGVSAKEQRGMDKIEAAMSKIGGVGPKHDAKWRDYLENIEGQDWIDVAEFFNGGHEPSVSPLTDAQWKRLRDMLPPKPPTPSERRRQSGGGAKTTVVAASSIKPGDNIAFSWAPDDGGVVAKVGPVTKTGKVTIYFESGSRSTVSINERVTRRAEGN